MTRAIPSGRGTLTLLTATTLLLTGCFGGPSVQRTYYSLQVPIDVPEAPRRFDVRIVVRPFDVAVAYRRQELVYRTNPYQFSFYNYRLWAARPDKLLTSVTTTYLRRSGQFESVSEDVGDLLPTYELTGEIVALEELDSTEKAWFGRLAMRIVLRTFEDRRTVWEHTFDRKERVIERDPMFVVKVINQILFEELAVAQHSLDAALLAKAHQVVERRTPAAPGGKPGQPTTKPDPPKERPRARRIR
ncbi:MAG: ABC-type uncharacterized transport system auxiliary subunit [Myxococcota bacterium]|jgi:ABC-type uncharacterized transport system auxiliary subunit